MNLLESEHKVATCQAPRECQTRSADYLKKPSMHQTIQQTSTISEQQVQKIFPTVESDLPYLDLRMRMKRGPQKERMKGFKPRMKQCSLNIQRPLRVQNRFCSENKTQLTAQLLMNWTCPDPCPGKIMKTLHNTFRTWVRWTYLNCDMTIRS